MIGRGYYSSQEAPLEAQQAYLLELHAGSTAAEVWSYVPVGSRRRAPACRVESSWAFLAQSAVKAGDAGTA